MRKEKVSIKEMVDITEKQLTILKSIVDYDNLSESKMYERRGELLDSMNEIYAYKEIKPGYAITRSIADPITAIRERILDITLNMLPKELKFDDYEVLLAKSSNMGKGFLSIQITNESLKNKKGLFNQSIQIGRVSIFTNEFQLYKYKGDEFKLDSEEIELHNNRLEYLFKQKETWEIILDESNTFNDILRISKEKGEEIKGFADKRKAKINFNNIRKNESDKNRATSRLESIIDEIKRIEDRQTHDMEVSEMKTELLKQSLSDYQSLREKLLKLGYKENTDEYFAYD